jgi:hypothetical protein
MAPRGLLLSSIFKIIVFFKIIDEIVIPEGIAEQNGYVVVVFSARAFQCVANLPDARLGIVRAGG